MDYIAGLHRAGDVFALEVSHTAAGNVGVGEDDLMTRSIPAALWSRPRKALRITAWGTTANNANAKTLKVYFGATLLLTVSLTASQVSPWRLVAEVVKSSTGQTQDWAISCQQGGATTQTAVATGTATENDTAAITVKCTGEATSDNDIVQEAMLVEVLNG